MRFLSIQLSLIALLAGLAPSDARAQDEGAPLALEGLVTLSHGGMFGRGVLEGATVEVAGADRSAVSDSNGRLVLTGVPRGEARIVVRHPRYEPKEETLTLEPGRLYAIGLMDRGWCPQGADCMGMPGAVLQLWAPGSEPAPREAEVALRLHGAEGSASTAWLDPPPATGAELTLDLDGVSYTVLLSSEAGGLGGRFWRFAIRPTDGPDGPPLIEGPVYGLGDLALPAGCESYCGDADEAITAVDIARSSLGDSLTLCAPEPCPP